MGPLGKKLAAGILTNVIRAQGEKTKGDGLGATKIE
jgi:hypothetical protein